MREGERRRVHERLATLAAAGLPLDEAQREAIAVLRRSVGFTRWCWPLTDPVSVLSTGGTAEFDLWPSLPRLAALEQHGDVTSKPALARAGCASVSLSAATGGDLSRSPRWRECLQPYGVGDELMTLCRDRHGCWASLELMRDSDEPPFAEPETQLLHEVAPLLGALVRRSQLDAWDTARDALAPLPPATLILDAEQRPASWTAGLAAWLGELGFGGHLPPAVFELGARALAPADPGASLPSRVRMRTASGRWAALEAAPLEGEGRGQVAVVVREAVAGEVFDLLARAYALTRRERELVSLVLEGLATSEVAATLCISQHTVQDHLKAVFAKTRVRSRRELASHLNGRV